MKELLVTALFVAGVLVGIWIGREYFSICDDPTLTEGTVQIPTLQVKPLSDTAAQQMAARFRSSMGYCEDKRSDIDLEKLGMFQLSKQTLLEMYASALQIDSIFSTRPPSSYRCFFGEDEGGQVHLMMVGMVHSTTTGSYTELSTAIMPTLEALPCPKLCDAPLGTARFSSADATSCD